MIHRKLSLTSNDNDTLSCPDGCDPYTYPIPFQQPLPPQTPPILSAKHAHRISPSVIIIATVLGSCFFLSTYFIVVKYFLGRNPFRPRRRQQEATDEEEFLDQNQGPIVDHPIWYINTIGLQQSVIDSITIFRYKKGESLIEGTECAVCLNEFQNDERLRLLPKCSHAFHIPCIDTWLMSHTNCPVCRAGIISNPVSPPVASTGPNSHSLRRDEDFQVEILENDEEMSTNQVRDEESCENTGDSASWVIDVPDNQIMMEGKNHEVQPVRRSVSLDSLLAANISRAVVNLCSAESEDIVPDQIVQVDKYVSGNNIAGNSRTPRIIDGGSSITQFLPKRPVEMKRSFSFAGRSFLSRQNSRTNSLHP